YGRQRLVRLLALREINQKRLTKTTQLNRMNSSRPILRFRISSNRFRQLPKLSPGRIVRAAGGHAEELVRFNYVRRQSTAIDAAGVKADCLLSVPRFSGRPMAEQNNLVASINFVPGHTLAAGRIRSH